MFGFYSAPTGGFGIAVRERGDRGPSLKKSLKYRCKMVNLEAILSLENNFESNQHIIAEN